MNRNSKYFFILCRRRRCSVVSVAGGGVAFELCVALLCFALPRVFFSLFVCLLRCVGLQKCSAAATVEAAVHFESNELTEMQFIYYRFYTTLLTQTHKIERKLIKAAEKREVERKNTERTSTISASKFTESLFGYPLLSFYRQNRTNERTKRERERKSINKWRNTKSPIECCVLLFFSSAQLRGALLMYIASVYYRVPDFNSWQ